ncbi:tetratricopeptide repeat protein [Streptomyces sp. NPDC058107]|uniref:tetratricopeptide repeat protein n=1 Tax=Streptomyces sp. NPDC058107 TaxID=3346343 RepID=UPI0036E31530
MLSTFHLGRVAQLRGDPELAEQCYLECLAIDEAEGAWTEVALDYGELGNVRAEQGLPEEALPLMARALSLHQQVKSDNALLNITALRQQRAALGDEEFARLLGRHFDEASVSAVLSLIAMLPTTGVARGRRAEPRAMPHGESEVSRRASGVRRRGHRRGRPTG